MNKINPNNPTVQALDDQWYKIAALLLFKLNGGRPVEITEADIAAFSGAGDRAIVADGRNDRVIFRLVSMEEAERLADIHGGRPI